MLTLPRPDRFAPSRWLVCLDLQRDYVVPGRSLYAPGHGGIVLACRQVLDVARAGGWRVVHSQTRDDDTGPTPRDMFGAPIEGLRPLVTEPVFFRRGLSAFANPAFAAEMRGARGAEVFLMGFSLAGSCLATALAAVDEGLELTLIEDAVGAGPAVGVAEAARSLLQPFVQIRSSSALLLGDLEVVG
jgi:nicotinamidase-related amidase